MDLNSLTDDELIQQMKLYNIEYGPVIPSTRRVYLKKLARVMAASETSQTSSTASTLPVDQVDMDGYDEVEDDDEPVVIQTRQSTRMERPETVRQRVIPEPEPTRTYTPQKTYRDEEPTKYSRASRYTESSSSSATSYHTAPSASLSRPPIHAQDIVTQAQPEPQAEPKKGVSIWLQLLIVLIVAFILFMVFQSMEPANKVPTRSIGQDV